MENVYRLFTDRNFAIIDKEGKKIGYARSVWAMISMNTRKPADLLALHSGSIVDYVCDEPCPIEKPSRIKVASKEPVAALVAKYSDIDINGHVNSIRYIEHILDLFPIEMYRHTAGVSMGMKITQAQAEAYLREYLRAFEKAVNKVLECSVTQNQFDALVSFAYNLGAGALRNSTLLKRLHAGDVKGAADEFPKWNKAAGKVLEGLTRRRMMERQLFLS